MVRAVGLTLAPIVVASFTALAIALTIMEWPGWRPELDSIWMVGMGVGGAFVMLRFASIVAKADEQGLFIRNIIGSRRLEWSQIVAVSYSAELGDPWARVSLSDGTTESVMAIQSADGRRAPRATALLRTLVDENTPTGGTS